MSRRLFFLPLLALLFLSAKKMDYVRTCLKEAGGEDRYARVETVDWSFSLARPSKQGVVTWQGRQRLKRRGDVFEIREDLDTPEGRWTVWVGSVSWVERDSVPVTDVEVRDSRVEEARRRAFWGLAPFPLLTPSPVGRYLGSAYFQNRLVRRVELDPVRRGEIFFPSPFVLFLDTTVPLLRGVVYGTGVESESYLFEGHELHQNLLTTARVWTRFNAEGKRVEVMRVQETLYNSYIDDTLMTFSAHTPQGE
ncbi:MAG: hypothetical protein JNK54_06745 [Elusimicrobia bacterium]|jgi:hypothetical protein|nr:hypothetical protein [Elusimicrobiota bacterium]